MGTWPWPSTSAGRNQAPRCSIGGAKRGVSPRIHSERSTRQVGSSGSGRRWRAAPSSGHGSWKRSPTGPMSPTPWVSPSRWVAPCVTSPRAWRQDVRLEFPEPRARRPRPPRPGRTHRHGRRRHRWNENDTQSVVGTLQDFSSVVTQRRHVDDTELVVDGPTARRWMEIASVSPAPRFRAPTPDTDRLTPAPTAVPLQTPGFRVQAQRRPRPVSAYRL